MLSPIPAFDTYSHVTLPAKKVRLSTNWLWSCILLIISDSYISLMIFVELDKEQILVCHIQILWSSYVRPYLVPESAISPIIPSFLAGKLIHKD